MRNFHAFTVKYHGATNTRGARVSITSESFEQRIYIDYDYSIDRSAEMAEIELNKRGFNIVGMASTKDRYILLSETFKPLK